ncbi:MAG: hypothetical protein ACK47B_13525 [Armatimonadota bacterium]
MATLLLGGADAAAQASKPGGREVVLARAARKLEAPPRLVLALYYPWYGLPKVSGQARHVGKIDSSARRSPEFAHTPQAGLYDSTDPAAVTRHFKQLKSAGVDAIACSWWGPKDFTGTAIRKLLPLAQREGLRVCLYVEQLPQGTTPAAALQWLADELEVLAKSPAYLKVEDRPVLFLYERAVRQLDPEQWAGVLEGLNRAVPPGVLAVADGDGLSEAMVFDGTHRNNPAPALAGVPPAEWKTRWEGVLRPAAERAHQWDRIAVATVSPGYDESRLVRNGAVIGRNSGDFYRRGWEAALALRPDWVLVRSFNQWHDGTEIEPSVEHGDLYLKLTSEYAARFRAQSGRAR